MSFKYFILLLIIYFPSLFFSQTNSSIFLVDLEVNENKFVFSNFKNISNNEGYNNQPYFKDNNTLLYAKNNDGQTDISVFKLFENSETFFNPKTEGGEYSPQPIPNSEWIAAVRLDPDGKQRLYRYKQDGTSSEIIDEAMVAYYAFYDAETLISSVIIEDELELIYFDFKNNHSYRLLKGSGRSIHKIPNKKAISYTSSNEEKNWDVYQLDMESLESFFIVQLPTGIQDMIWINDSQILIGSGAKLFFYDLFENGDWKQVANFSEKGIKNITRMTLSQDGNKLAFVAEKN